MDFHDFPRILGKSGCESHPPPQDMYRPTRLPSIFYFSNVEERHQVAIRAKRRLRYSKCTYVLPGAA